MPSRVPTRPKSTNLWLFEQLRSAIIRGDLSAGETLRQEDIAAQFHVSRMPVREAMRLLEAEGLVRKEPHRGAVVAELDPDDALELFEIRAALEAVAVRRSFPKLTPAQIESIEKAHLELEKATEKDKLLRHRSFHLALYAAAGPRLQKMISDQLDAAQRYHLRFGRRGMEVSERDRREHTALVKAARSRDVNAAVAIIESHVRDGGIMGGCARGHARRRPVQFAAGQHWGKLHRLR